MLKEITNEVAVHSSFPQKLIYTRNENFARWRSSKGASSLFTAIWLTCHGYHLNYMYKNQVVLIAWCSKVNALILFPSANAPSAKNKAIY